MSRLLAWAVLAYAWRATARERRGAERGLRIECDGHSSRRAKIFLDGQELKCVIDLQLDMSASGVNRVKLSLLPERLTAGLEAAVLRQYPLGR